MTCPLKEVESVEILTLQDNYIDVLVMDSDTVIKRPLLVKESTASEALLSASPLAEHGFASFITVKSGDGTGKMLFDFGGSPHGAAFNADLLSLDLSGVQALALSHGHMDHFGGLRELVGRTGRKDLTCVVHPGVFKKNRYVRTPNGNKLCFPPLARDDFRALDIALQESVAPVSMLDDTVLFLGEVPRKCVFESGMANAFYDEDGVERRDIIEDDSALVFHVRNRGLVVLSGCAHSGIINTVNYAREVTGVKDVYAVMGGFHLIGADPERVITPTIDALQGFSPRYVVPCHCTGRSATLEIEKRMPEAFILNMAATCLCFAGEGGDNYPCPSF
jgi:7,8-dihydropterin-6-yl-methyl-4-(beta-D-ribofuranosyl)aminobenzene 5'-phosphate synthase